MLSPPTSHSSPPPLVPRSRRIESSAEEEESENVALVTVEAFLQQQSSPQRGCHLWKAETKAPCGEPLVGRRGFPSRGFWNWRRYCAKIDKKRRARQSASRIITATAGVTASGTELKTKSEAVVIGAKYRGDPLSLPRKPVLRLPTEKCKMRKPFKNMSVFPQPAFKPSSNDAGLSARINVKKGGVLHVIPLPALHPTQIPKQKSTVKPKLDLVPGLCDTDYAHR